MKFSDNLIADIAKVLQIGILSGTDIVDHLRTFEVEEIEDLNQLKLTAASKERIEKEIEIMLEEIAEFQNK